MDSESEDDGLLDESIWNVSGDEQTWCIQIDPKHIEPGFDAKAWLREASEDPAYSSTRRNLIHALEIVAQGYGGQNVLPYAQGNSALGQVAAAVLTNGVHRSSERLDQSGEGGVTSHDRSKDITDIQVLAKMQEDELRSHLRVPGKVSRPNSEESLNDADYDPIVQPAPRLKPGESLSRRSRTHSRDRNQDVQHQMTGPISRKRSQSRSKESVTGSGGLVVYQQGQPVPGATIRRKSTAEKLKEASRTRAMAAAAAAATRTSAANDNADDDELVQPAPRRPRARRGSFKVEEYNPEAPVIGSNENITASVRRKSSSRNRTRENSRDQSRESLHNSTEELVYPKRRLSSARRGYSSTDRLAAATSADNLNSSFTVSRRLGSRDSLNRSQSGRYASRDSFNGSYDSRDSSRSGSRGASRESLGSYDSPARSKERLNGTFESRKSSQPLSRSQSGRAASSDARDRLGVKRSGSRDSLNAFYGERSASKESFIINRGSRDNVAPKRRVGSKESFVVRRGGGGGDSQESLDDPVHGGSADPVFSTSRNTSRENLVRPNARHKSRDALEDTSPKSTPPSRRASGRVAPDTVTRETGQKGQLASSSSNTLSSPSRTSREGLKTTTSATSVLSPRRAAATAGPAATPDRSPSAAGRTQNPRTVTKPKPSEKQPLTNTNKLQVEQAREKAAGGPRLGLAPAGMGAGTRKRILPNPVEGGAGDAPVAAAASGQRGSVASSVSRFDAKLSSTRRPAVAVGGSAGSDANNNRPSGIGRGGKAAGGSGIPAPRSAIPAPKGGSASSAAAGRTRRQLPEVPAAEAPKTKTPTSPQQASPAVTPPGANSNSAFRLVKPVPRHPDGSEPARYLDSSRGSGIDQAPAAAEDSILPLKYLVPSQPQAYSPVNMEAEMTEDSEWDADCF